MDTSRADGPPRPRLRTDPGTTCTRHTHPALLTCVCHPPPVPRRRCWAALAASLALIGECAPAVSADTVRQATRGASASSARKRYAWGLVLCAAVALATAVQPESEDVHTDVYVCNASQSARATEDVHTWESIFVAVFAGLVIFQVLVLLAVGDRMAAMDGWQQKLPTVLAGGTLLSVFLVVFVGTFRNPFLATGTRGCCGVRTQRWRHDGMPTVP